MRSDKMTVLITGATSGIGLELAGIFAQNHCNLILVARNKEKLENLKMQFSAKYPIMVKTISLDLALLDSADTLYRRLLEEGFGRIDILVNNAGFNAYGKLVSVNLDDNLGVINLQVITMTKLTHYIVKDMLKNKSGRVLNIASTGSFVSTPLCAVYSASKAYMLSFSEALAQELEGSGVSITTLCPGATATNFAKTADMEDIWLFKIGVMRAKDVAHIGYRAVMKRKRLVIAGWLNKIQIFWLRFLPRKFTTKFVNLIMTRAG